MDSKAIKSALKEARDAIKNKEYAFSMKLCKNILKSDKENYMALVFLGISLQEIGPKEQAQHAFRKAILANPDQLLAWTGLANYFEKDESDNACKELIPIYEKLLNNESDVSKFNDMCSKLISRALQIKEINKPVDIFKSLACNEKNSANYRQISRVSLVSLLSQSNDLSDELLQLFEENLSIVLKDEETVSCNFYKEYLKLLYKLKKYELLFGEAINMHLKYTSNIYPLVWICKIYVELSIENNQLVNLFESRIDQFCDKIFSLQADAVMGFFVKAVRFFEKKNFILCRDELKKVVSMRSNLTHAWVLLSECSFKLYCYEETVQNASKADKLLLSSSKENSNLRIKINKILICSLAKHSSSEKWKDAIELGNKILEDNPKDIDVISSIITAYINLENYDKAETYLKQINESTTYALLKSKLLSKKGDIKTALITLQEVNDKTSEIYIEIGSLYLHSNYYESSLMSCLKAAKIDPNYYLTFVFLGRCYEYLKDVDKARRCYQKAFKINPRCVEAGVGLSNIYRQQKNWDANLELLESVTGTDTNAKLQIISSEVHWAWLQLGLHYLEQGEHSKAIDNLQTVIRVESNNGHYWECLADAYMARGSYIAAMKSYERAIELLENALYSKLQFATIKFILGFHAEAKLAFENLLSENKRYVPALKGLAENCLSLAVIQRKNQLIGLSRDNSQYALEQLTIALKERSDLSCLWKLIGDSCFLVAGLPEKYCYLIVEASLAENRNSSELVPLDKIELHSLAARCYCKAINACENNNALLWHDLGMCYYSHACCIYDAEDRKDILKQALVIAKYCVTNNPGYWKHWNLLGVIALHKDLKNYSLAQHAFIKAVSINYNCAMAWSNLGTLYFKLNNINLANKAYSQAQIADPYYVNSWIGQALIAEYMDHEEAMDLFRHSTQLGHHAQGALGYANWVCKTILDLPRHVNVYSIHNMHAIPIAHDALTWYIENNPYDSCAWNMLGMLKERLGFGNSTLEAYKRSLKLSNKENIDKALINCGRILVKLEKYEEAISMYKKVKVASFNNGCGLALALFKAQQYKESYEAYDTTMNWLAENENLQSHVLVALAAMMYLFKGAEGAKTLLFQSTQLKPPSQWGLFATLALGLLQGDLPMANLVLKELQPIKDEPDIIYHYSVLLSLKYLREGDKKGAIRSITKSIHRHPDQANLWHYLSVLLLSLDPQNQSHLAAHCATGSMKMGRAQMDVSKILCIVSLASCVSKDLKSALFAAQKAIHCYPDVAEGWAVLITALSYLDSIKNRWNNVNEWISQAADHVKINLKTTDALEEWFNKLC